MSIPTYDGWPGVTAQRLRRHAADTSLAPCERVAAAVTAVALERPVMASRVMAMTGLSAEDYAAGVDDLVRTGLAAPGSGTAYVFAPGVSTLAAVVPSFDAPAWQENLPNPGFETSAEALTEALRGFHDDRPVMMLDDTGDEAEVAA